MSLIRFYMHFAAILNQTSPKDFTPHSPLKKNEKLCLVSPFFQNIIFYCT